MHYKRKLFVQAAILSICLFFSSVFAENDLNFNVPLPANSKLLDSKEFQMGSRQINTVFYNSQENAAAVAGFYADFFMRQGFQRILDKSNAKTGRQLLRFKKESLVVSISITGKDAGTDIVIAKYLQAPGELSPEETKPSVKDSIYALPKSDVPGADIDGIPRPTSSVRIMSLRQGKTATVMYTTPMDVAAAVNFYRKRMPDYDWKFLRQTGAEEATQAYMKESGKKDLGIRSPFSDGEDIEQVINDSYVLSFASGAESVQITVFPNFTSRALGSMVQVSYSAKE